MASLWIVFVLLPFSAVSAMEMNCGDGHCVCTGHVADCRYSKLTYVPKFHENITELYLSYTSETLSKRLNEDPNAFQNATGIKVLLLVSCGLRRIPNLPESVEVVDLSFNDITQIKKGDFERSPNIRILTLSQCRLIYIQPAAFDPLITTLQTLDLSYNKFRHFPESSLSRLAMDKTLQHLDVSFNDDLICDCGAVALGHWMHQSPERFHSRYAKDVAREQEEWYRCWNSTETPRTQLSIAHLEASTVGRRRRPC